MKPFLEKVTHTDNASWAMLDRQLDDGIPFEWHHHPEYELTLTLNSRGQRFVGDHIGTYKDGDLVLLGPDLPHTWFSADRSDKDAPHRALVMWFGTDWADSLTGTFTELRPVASMLAEARRGLKFSDHTAKRLRPTIEALFNKPPAERLLDLIGLLNQLTNAPDAICLASPGRATFNNPTTDRPRIERALDYMHSHYMHPIKITEIAEVAALSVSGTHRLLRRHTRLRFSDYIARLRIGAACALLSGTDKPIATIADIVGYPSLANFNRQFKALKNMTPRAFRQQFSL